MVSALLGTMLALGSSANAFSGLSLFNNILPFAAGMACWVIVAAALLLGWLKWRPWLRQRLIALPAILSLALSLGLIWFASHDGSQQVFSDFRSLVGGKQQAARTTLAHQVYAAYRRHDQALLQKMITRAEPYQRDIQQAAEAFGLDENILNGIAATESSFLPRPSHDGGQGLFQITAVPKHIWQQASERLNVKQLELTNPRHNAFIAAATLKYYWAEMKDDLFLGLLAYNIGPRNGGLRFIMQQYGADDFISMQPYLQQLPRDYPIRVLSYALAFKLWRQDGGLLAYQDGDNAVHIQRVGIPGLTTLF
ncbi:lytic transglycosylase domain-containing protein [Methylomonas rapida]|uniref:Transglycosylase SLT domain-containing protein n=1 Tax=Methylomonas rapida TaxID=2963939 RepID=A0ABY7GJS7_9GAMM|nr:transglycosylase SLT domain-containing protein [Methylomonas rapida]WAR44538.1 transglycosylase SLT domain-containing protein [Methylomonas rapida]